MTGSTQQEALHSAPLAANDTSINDDGLDNISLTSTVEEAFSPDTEFAVEGIRAERDIEGVHMYLVEWSNFPLDQCTYEPESNLRDELKAEWEEKKVDHSLSEATDFEQRFLAAKKKKLEESRQRHRRRNARRKQLGLPTTSFHFRGAHYPDSEDDIDQATEPEDFGSEYTHDNQYDSNAWNDSSESDEAGEDNQVDHTAAEACISSTSPSQAKSRPKPPPNRIFSVCPTQAASAKESIQAATPRASTEAHSNGSNPGHQTTKQPSKPREMPLSIGNQGSALRLSSSTARDGQPQNKSTALPARPYNAVHVKQNTQQLTARRTQSVNIFSGGKKRKQRITTDAPEGEKTTYHFKNARALRRSELGSRDRDDQAPDIRKVSLFAPGSIADTQPPVAAERTLDRFDTADDLDGVAQEASAQSSMALSIQGKPPVRTFSEPRSTISRPKRSSLIPDAGRPAKKAKSVRFTEVDDEPTISREPRSVRFCGADELFVREPMGIDEVVESPVDLVAATESSSQVVNRNSGVHQNVSKHIKLATSPNRTLNTVFTGVPKSPAGDSEPQWLRAFLDIDCLHFTHTVLAETLMSQLASLDSRFLEYLCSGAITSAEDNEALETIAGHLRTGHLGLFVPQIHFNVLICPTKCDGFQLERFGAEFMSTDGVSLQYFAFTTTCSISQLIRTKTGRPNLSQVKVGQEMPALFSKILGVRLSPLINGSSHGKARHFFLAFPERALEWQRSFCSWLHTRDSRSKIYTNFLAGSWSAFVERATQECGVVLIHEAVVPFARRFPGISKLLQTDSCTVWRFSESPGAPDSLSLHGSTGGHVISPMLSSMFTLGMAILITPSFILSQPQETFKLFKWFFTSQARVSYNKLITAYNIRDYLRDLATERSRQKLLRATRWSSMAALDVASEKNDSALADEDVEASQRTWLEVDRWLGQQAEPDTPFSEENHVIYADQSIDPNDEQSLVNWFGWWTLTRSEAYRKFYIIGSDSSYQGIMRPGSQLLPRMSRNLKIPTYGPTVVNDPDKVLRDSEKTGPNSLKKNTATSLEGCDKATWTRSQRYFKNGERDIRGFLKLHDRPGHARVFQDPVSYLDMTMADHFGDPTMICATYDQWWNRLQPWLYDSNRMFNTYIAFFYTIRKDWIPSEFPQGLKPRRHAWLAIYRPVEPHIKNRSYQHGRSEIIIWDVRAGVELEKNDSIGLAELTWMQRELIRYVQLHAQEKNPGSFLEAVWLSGFQAQQTLLKSTSAMDKTAEFFEILTGDLQRVVPGSTNYLLQNGYRPVSLNQKPEIARIRTASFGQSADAMDEFCEDMRIIFHPPRGSITPHLMGTSDCTNDLFEASRLARLRNQYAKEMTYTYRPTLEWYQQQIAEGRQFEHIRVGGWDEVSKLLDVNGQGKPPISATSEQSPGSSRRSSVSSNHSGPKT